MPSDQEIEELALKLKKSRSTQDRIDLLHRCPQVRESSLVEKLSKLRSAGQAAILQLIALEQMPKLDNLSDKEIADLANLLSEVDHFYREMGGIAGYQMHVRKLLQKKSENLAVVQFHSPSFIDISQRGPEVDEAVEKGIESLPYLCEMYPLGGAADRLHLVDEKTGGDLPAAKLQFAGKTLFERLICDLESRERLYYQRTGQKIFTPVAIMTSLEKNNRAHVQEILEKSCWFGRPKERFFLFDQPLVPTVDEKGNWIWNGAKPLMKPGGHGAIWKLAIDHGVFDWFRSFGSKYALIRQINNPLAGLDYGLLAFTGLGISKKMAFGFASCPRACQAAEGVNVVVERKLQDGYRYNLSNIEYCDFEKYGIQDTPIHPGEPYSRFTSNTNILFGSLDALESAVKMCPFPGLLMNLKEDSKGRFAGRLESTMQNIADVFVETSAEPLREKRLQKTFITYNERSKTISTAKKAYAAGRSLNETPEKCFYDLMTASRTLLQNECRMRLPRERTLEETLISHPSFVFLFHPSLGPLFRVIGSKLQGGSLQDGSELRLEIGDAFIENLVLDGSLLVSAEGGKFAEPPAVCRLKNCTILNRGVDWECSKPFWKGDYLRKETLRIELGKGAEFIAEGVELKGDLHFVVPDGMEMRIARGSLPGSLNDVVIRRLRES